MAGASLLALLDDIASILDDVAAMTKVAAKKTAGVLGDDLALNAQQVSGVHADRELPVVRAVAVGSLKNKAILVPAALAISALLPWLVTPLLMIGGLYLCFEGVEKLAHKFLHGHDDKEEDAHDLEAELADFEAREAEKIKGAVRTDFVLSAEIIVIALGTVAAMPFMTRVLVLVGIALLMTVGVYGLVAAIVKLDDLGLHLAAKRQRVAQALGRALLLGAPWLMKTLAVVGTAAMFLVGGGILLHGLPFGHALEHWAEGAGWLGMLASPLAALATGLVAGALALGAVELAAALKKRLKRAPG